MAKLETTADFSVPSGLPQHPKALLACGVPAAPLPIALGDDG